jgi:hypothetical protein
MGKAFGPEFDEYRRELGDYPLAALRRRGGTTGEPANRLYAGFLAPLC